MGMEIAKWDGSIWSALWSALETGMNGDVYALHIDSGNLYAGGGFAEVGGNAANKVAEWSGSAFAHCGEVQDAPQAKDYRPEGASHIEELEQLL
jgi:hypothetical protein